MATCTHVLLNVEGGYNDGSLETWQFGIRFFVENNAIAPDTSGTLPTFDTVPATVARSEADWNITSTWAATVGALTFNPDDWLNDQVAPALHDNFGFGISANVKMLRLKASPITSSGHVGDLETTILDWTGSYPVGSTAGNMLPPQDSVVVSTKTPRIGANGRGRFFLPPSGDGDTTTGGRLTSTSRGNLLTAMVAILEGMAITDSITPHLWVIPAVIGAPWTSYGQITSIDIGDVIDTQRRRRRSLVEARVSADVSY